MHYLREHEEKCAKKKSNTGVGMKSLETQMRKSLLATEKSSDENYETTDSDESEILETLAKESTSDEYSDTGTNEKLIVRKVKKRRRSQEEAEEGEGLAMGELKCRRVKSCESTRATTFKIPSHCN